MYQLFNLEGENYLEKGPVFYYKESRREDYILMGLARTSHYNKGGTMRIMVMYKDGKIGSIDNHKVERLIASYKIIKFFRSMGWVTIGQEPIRGWGGDYQGPERRRRGYINN